MPQELFARGLAIGFAVAFALGPIGLLVIRRTLERGWRLGFVSGLGVATADATYAAIAAFGLTALTGLLVGIERPLAILGGMLLLVLATRALRDALGPTPSGRDPQPDLVAPGAAGRRDARGAWLTMVALTLTNPATILSFAALFASIGASAEGLAGATAVVAGVFTGSIAWWGLLTGVVAGMRTRLTSTVVRGLTMMSALIVAGFGAAAIAIGISG
jgi:putative LysE/RhtB family amino acid efflux pump